VGQVSATQVLQQPALADDARFIGNAKPHGGAREVLRAHDRAGLRHA
jgi:hypothetical protein